MKCRMSAVFSKSQVSCPQDTSSFRVCHTFRHAPLLQFGYLQSMVKHATASIDQFVFGEVVATETPFADFRRYHFFASFFYVKITVTVLD